MCDDAKPKGRDPRHALLRERMKLAAERESVRARAREWRDRSDEERVAVFADLFDTTVLVRRTLEHKYEKPPLSFPRFSSGKPYE